MKRIIFYFILVLGMIGCNSDDNNTQGHYIFIKEYSATVTVGGVVGIEKRTFKKGDTYKGTDEKKETIKIRIAEHTESNDRCPNSWCYQEFLEVPREFLKIIE